MYEYIKNKNKQKRGHTIIEQKKKKKLLSMIGQKYVNMNKLYFKIMIVCNSSLYSNILLIKNFKLFPYF